MIALKFKDINHAGLEPPLPKWLEIGEKLRRNPQLRFLSMIQTFKAIVISHGIGLILLINIGEDGGNSSSTRENKTLNLKNVTFTLSSYVKPN